MANVQIIGLEDVEDILNNIAPRHARNLMRATVYAVAGKARDEVRKNAPGAKKNRIRKATKVRRRKSPPDAPVAEVHIGKEAFFWRFHEHGTVKMAPSPFVLPAKEKIERDKVRVVTEEFGKKLVAALKRASR